MHATGIILAWVWDHKGF